MRAVLRVVFAYAVAAGCLPSFETFHCETDRQCGAGGRCESSSGGLCSFPDFQCPSGYRFGSLAGPQSNKCVGAQPVDAGIDAAVDAAVDAPPDVAIDAPPDATLAIGSSSD